MRRFVARIETNAILFISELRVCVCIRPFIAEIANFTKQLISILRQFNSQTIHTANKSPNLMAAPLFWVFCHVRLTLVNGGCIQL